ncbi:MAG TPA: TlpA disulfide reductase family protein [Azospira sp.]|nr:TlpA disulfide reductase family protein [Azospira sp.]
MAWCRLWPLLVLPAGCARAPAAPVAVGDPFPAFELSDLQRQPRRRDDFLGGPRLINFWATWCPPCRAEMTGLQVLHRQLQAQGGGVVAVSVDDDANLVREFVLKLGIDYPVLLDPGRALAAGVLRLTAYPTSFLLRADGRVAEVVIGERDWASPERVAAVLATLR